jgi:hypothetical protein
MGFILFVVLVGACAWCFYKDQQDLGGWVAAALTCLALGVFAGTALLVQCSSNIEKPVEYKQVLAFYEVSLRSKNLTGEERSRLIMMTVQMNKKIEEARVWAKIPVVGWYAPGDVVALEPFDLGKIPGARSSMSLEKE